MRINPNSSIRSGYRFEDLFVIRLCFDWLKTPKLYKNIKIQYIPDEVNTTKFYLDDIVVTDKNNCYHLYQLKYKQNPNTDFWTFDKLLDKIDNKPSLLEKWVKSFFQIQSKCNGSLITNGCPDDVLKDYLKHDKLDIQKIREQAHDTFQRILLLFSSEKELNVFFELFTFVFNYPNKELLEVQTRTLYYNELKVTKSGFDNLLLHISKEGSQQYPQEFTIANIKNLLEWYNPRPLKQNFEIPEDFELYDNSKHSKFLNDLKNTKGGIKVIIGKPGVGKSTYLSNLHFLLSEKLGILSIRHHYHLNPKDLTYYERLDAKRAIEGLKAEIRKLPPEVLGKLANQNLLHTPLNELLEAIAEYHYNNGKTFVLIIDGLDHVIRERKSEKELIAFLDEILYPQEGLWIVLGTQELAISHFRNIIFNVAPRNTWIEIKGLKKESVRNLIEKNNMDLILPEHQHLKNEVIAAIFQKTGGNALHLRYVLNQLKAKNAPLTSAALRSILPYKDDIANYYADLWRQIPSISKTFALAIVLFDCKLKEEDIYDFGNYLTTSSSKISDSVNQIRHLLRIDISGISVYHNSFLVFINNQIELEQQKKSLYTKSRKWLKKTSNEYLQWVLLPKVEYYLGNSKNILQIDRKWVIDSYLKCRNEIQIIGLLKLAAEAAFKAKDYSKVLLYRIYDACLSEREYNLSDVTPKIWGLAFKLNAKGKLLYPDIDTLEAYQIKEYLIALSSRGVIQIIPDEIYDRFNELLMDTDRHRDDEVVPHWLELIAYFDNEVSTKRIHKFISQFKHNDNSARYYAKYIRYLLRYGKTTRLTETLKHRFSGEEKDKVVDVLVKYNLENGTSYGIDIITNSKNEINSYLVEIYLLLKTQIVPNKTDLPVYSQFPREIEYHSTSKSVETLNLYLETFFNGIKHYLQEEAESIENWILGADDRWSLTLMNKLFEVSKYLADAIQSNGKIDYVHVIDMFDPIRMLDYRDDHDIYELRRYVLPNCITNILRICLFINKAKGHDYYYTDEDVKKLSSNKWFYNNTLVTHLFTFDTPPITQQGLEELVNHGIKDLEFDVQPFRDKAETIVNLALIADACNNVVLSKKLLLLSAQNIISYGYHKDMYLYSILKGIDICAKEGSLKIQKYLTDVAPFIHFVGDFTDGDETGSFIHDLAELYGKYNKGLLYKLYSKSVIEQDYYKSDSFFADIVSILPLPNAINSSILSTCIDNNSYNTLKYRATSETEAKKILNSIQKTFGNIDYSTNYGNDNCKHKYRKEKKPNYSKVQPAKIERHLTNIKPLNYQAKEYVQRNYLKDWLKHWLTKHEESAYDVYWAVKKLIAKHLDETDEEVFEMLYPIAKKVDKDFAFECLIWGHANSSIWGAVWSKSLEESKKMWAIAKSDFPDRLDEYFEKTIFYSGVIYDRGEEYFIPIPKSIAFFSDRGNLNLAEEILESAIHHLKELTPGIKLPELNYLNENSHYDEFDILLMRLTWINPIVRERVALGLSQLLQNDTDGVLHKRMMKWFSEQNLESITSFGLIAIIKSLDNLKSKSYLHLNATELIQNINTKSTVLYILLNIIFQDLKEVFPQFSYSTKETIDIIDVPELDKFQRNIGHHIQFIFTDLCTKLERKTKFKVFNLWALIFENKKKALGFTHGRHVDDYCNSKREYMVARSTIISDLLRSAFMKVLDYLYHHNYIDSQMLFRESYRLIPIDMSLWRINLSQPPAWYPKFITDKEEGKDIILTSDLINPISNIIKPQPGWRLLHLDGAIIPSGDFYDGTLNGNIKILPFAYKVTGSDLPEKETIYKLVENYGDYYPSGNYLDSFNFFDNEISFYSEFSFPSKIKDLLVFPLLADINSLSGNTWQLYRMFRTLKLPIPMISYDLAMQIKKGNLEFVDSNNEVIYKAKDFLFGLKDRVPYKSEMPYGRYLLANEDYIDSILTQQNLQLGYICKVDYKTRKYKHSDEVQEATFFELINFSTLIIP